jgi:hypothetical protein
LTVLFDDERTTFTLFLKFFVVAVVNKQLAFVFAFSFGWCLDAENDDDRGPYLLPFYYYCKPSDRMKVDLLFFL